GRRGNGAGRRDRQRLRRGRRSGHVCGGDRRQADQASRCDVARPAHRVRRSTGRLMTIVVPALDGPLQAYLDPLTIERGVEASTWSCYRRDLRRYQEHLMLRGILDLGDVTENDVSEFLASLRRGDPDAGVAGLSAVSAARAVIAVRGLHRFATAEGMTAV